MSYPCLNINLKKITSNCRIINDRCTGRGISVVGVSKCVLGDIKIAESFRQAGIKVFGDSRLENLIKMRKYLGMD